jgi:HlyD family secretion protein
MALHQFEPLNSATPVHRRIDARYLRVTAAAFLTVAVALSIALTSACSSKEKEAPVATVQVQAATVESKTIEERIMTHAVLYPRDQAAIVPRVSAPIKEFYVNRGSRVHAGQLLATLENKDLVGALTESQGTYDQAQAAYDSAVQSAGSDLKAAQEQLQAARSLYDGRVALLKQGAVAEKDVQDAKVALTQASNQYDLAEKRYNLKVAEGQFTAAKGKLASAQAQVDYSKIVSPIDGVVTDRPFYPGETPPTGAAILTVMELSTVVARGYVTPEQAAQLHIGDPASVVPQDGSGEVSGKVTVVSPALDPNSTTLQVWVEVPNPRGRLKPGSTVGLAIVAKSVKNALVVPAEALLTAPDGTTSVAVIGQDQTAHQTAVKTGIREDDEVQILSGLQAGQRVVTQGAYGLPDGTKVTVAEPSAPPEKAD